MWADLFPLVDKERCLIRSDDQTTIAPRPVIDHDLLEEFVMDITHASPGVHRSDILRQLLGKPLGVTWTIRILDELIRLVIILLRDVRVERTVVHKHKMTSGLLVVIEIKPVTVL